MDTRKTTLIATVAVILLLAVGIGYAYTAFTQNGGNETDTAYVTLTQVGGETPYTFAKNVTFELDTYNDTNAQTVYYKLHGSTDIKSANPGNYTCVLLGSITLHAELTGATDYPDLTVSISNSAGFDATNNWVYLITSAPNAQGQVTVYDYKKTSSATAAWTPVSPLKLTKDGTSYKDVNLFVYYGYLSSAVVEKEGVNYFKENEAPTKLHEAKLTFKAASDSATHDLTYMANYTGAEPASGVIEDIESPVYILPTDLTGLAITAPQDKVLKGWSLTPDGALLGPTIYLNEDKTVYAIWEDEPPSP